MRVLTDRRRDAEVTISAQLRTEAGNGREAGGAPLGYEIVCLNTVPAPKRPDIAAGDRIARLTSALVWSGALVSDGPGGRLHYGLPRCTCIIVARFTEPNPRFLPG